MTKHPTRLNFTTLLLTSPILLFVFVATAHADDEDTGASRDRIMWPSPNFPTLQDAVDAAADDATIKLRKGTFRIDSTIRIRGKRLKFVGAGNGSRRGRVTRLIGPEPRPVVDAIGNIILAADEAIGLFQVESDSDVEFSKMHISGFDAGIIIRHDERTGRAPNVHVNKLLISHTGRGILSFSASQLIVANTIIEFTLWNGISLAKAPIVQLLHLKGLEIFSPHGAGIYGQNTTLYVDKAVVFDAGAGGIVCDRCTVVITNSLIFSNRKAGILLNDSGGFIVQNTIFDTDSFGPLLGDGISVWSSAIHAENNSVDESERAAVSNFGGYISLKDSTLTCASFDIGAEPWNGQPAIFNDMGGVLCGCGEESRPCVAKSFMLEPPPPVGGLE